MQKTLIAVVGPTAIGKTNYAIATALHYGTEVVSCDSRQCYREMSIGVARPSQQELSAVPHHLIACRSVAEGYNVYTFMQEAHECLRRIFAKHDIAVAVGGSGLYVDALCRGVALMPDPPQELREQLQRQIREEGLQPLQQRLKELDPDYYHRVDLNNPVRVQRALEVCLTTGKPYSQVLQQETTPRFFRTVKVGLQCDRAILRHRIDSRVDLMMQQGLLDEVRTLLPLRRLQTLNTVGYKELFSHLDGTLSLEEAVAAIKMNTWHYAKKQMSYFARDKETLWCEAKENSFFELP